MPDNIQTNIPAAWICLFFLFFLIMQRSHIGSVHLLQGYSEKLVQVDLGVPGVHHIHHCPFTGM